MAEWPSFRVLCERVGTMSPALFRFRLKWGSSCSFTFSHRPRG